MLFKSHLLGRMLFSSVIHLVLPRISTSWPTVILTAQSKSHTDSEQYFYDLFFFPFCIIICVMSRLKAQGGAKRLFPVHYFVEPAPYNFLLWCEQMLSILEKYTLTSQCWSFFFFFFFLSAISELIFHHKVKKCIWNIHRVFKNLKLAPCPSLQVSRLCNVPFICRIFFSCQYFLRIKSCNKVYFCILRTKPGNCLQNILIVPFTDSLLDWGADTGRTTAGTWIVLFFLSRYFLVAMLEDQTMFHP